MRYLIVLLLVFLLSSSALAQRQWEYATLSLSQFETIWMTPTMNEHGGTLDTLVNELEISGLAGETYVYSFLRYAGEQGWELVAVYQLGDSLQYVFKRPNQ